MGFWLEGSDFCTMDQLFGVTLFSLDWRLTWDAPRARLPLCELVGAYIRDQKILSAVIAPAVGCCFLLHVLSLGKDTITYENPLGPAIFFG